MSTKYVIDIFGTGIRAHECVKETAQFVWLKGIYSTNTTNRRRKGVEAFDTWAEAHAELTRRAEAKLAEARRALQAAQGFAGNVRGMKPPHHPRESEMSTPADWTWYEEPPGLGYYAILQCWEPEEGMFPGVVLIQSLPLAGSHASGLVAHAGPFPTREAAEAWTWAHDLEGPVPTNTELDAGTYAGPKTIRVS